MALAIPWRAGRAGAGRLGVAASPQAEQVRPGRISFLATDAFLDAVILACVVMFLVLALGVAVLALQVSQLHLLG
ncbi:MAG TPA: hypothetical protein VFD94_04490 [Jatrophihabitans sp.]|nr:hypothetical protein [Jatrophihabitans sp.]